MLRIVASSVPEFMRAILPTEPHFAGPPTSFRGQADSGWGLTPALWRKRAWDPLGGAESHGLKVVGEAVDDGISSVVEVGQALIYTLGQVVKQVGLPPLNIGGDEVEGLAQHIGLPTRLLDWTRSPLVAAYFAAADVVRMRLADGNLAVYAMSPLFREHSHLLENLHKPNVAGFGNPNLVAQHGLFIRVEPPRTDLLAGVEVTSLPCGQAIGFVGSRLVDNHLAQILLPHEHAARLLRTLRDQGVHGASLFPGHLGVLELVREVCRCPEVGIRPSSGGESS
jgi:hypothetical protein